MKLWAWTWVAVAAVIAVGLLLGKEDGTVDSGPIELRAEEQTILLALAREALRAHLAGDIQPEIDEQTLAEALRQQAACFVTLSKDGALRGCILDTFEAHEPIYRNVMRNVILAATADPRFSPVHADELDSLEIEISVLGTPYELELDDPGELPGRLRPHVDGVILTTAYGTSTYLPQVWDQLPDPETFLTELCRKHGAPGTCWRTGGLLRVELYQVTRFSEAES